MHERNVRVVSMNGVAGLAVIAGALLVPETQALAQTAPPDRTILSEIIVTATRRTDDLQKVSVSATVRDSAQLKNEGITDLQNLQNAAPGLSIQPASANEPFLNIRGVGIQQANPASSPGVAFYVDGIYIATQTDTVNALYDVSNVEVLRGPQGTLVGSNADGGAIFVNSVQPTLDRVKGYVDQYFGKYGYLRSEGAINIPLGDKLAVRMAIEHESRDSFSTNVDPTTGAKTANQPGSYNYTAGRIQVLYRPNSQLEFTLRFEPYQQNSAGPDVKPDMVALSPANPDYDPYAASIQNQPFKTDYNTPQYYNMTGQRGALTGVWHFSEVAELKSITAEQTGVLNALTDVDYASANSTEILRGPTFEFTQELNLISTSHGSFEWDAGVYYLYTKRGTQVVFTNPPPLTNSAISVEAMHYNVAAFASGTYKLTPQFSLTLGGRYSHDTSPFTELGCTGFPQICGNFSTRDSEFTGNARLNFQATPETLIYASVSNGYKAGGVNLSIPDVGITPPPFTPETNIVEELGVKTTVLEHHLRIDGDIFNSNYKHYQLQEFKNGFPLTQGPGQASIYGAELELTGKFGGFDFDTGVSYLHGTVNKDFVYEGLTAPLTITAGTVVPFAPKWMVNAGAQYRFDMPWGGVTPRIQYQYQATQYALITYLAEPGPDTVIPSHGTLDARLTFDLRHNLLLQGYVTNLTNRTYLSNVAQNVQAGAPALTYAPPRQFGARLEYRF